MPKISFVIFCFLTASIHLSAQKFEWARSPEGGYIYRIRDSHNDLAGNVYVIGDFYNTISFGKITLVSNGSPNGFIVKYSGRGDVIWAKKIGSPSGGGSSIYEIKSDNKNNIYVTGWTSNTATFGNGAVSGKGIFLAKYDSSGTVKWVNKLKEHTTYQHHSRYFRNYLLVDKNDEVFFCDHFWEDTLAFGGLKLASSTKHLSLFLSKISSSTGEVEWVKEIAYIDKPANEVSQDLLRSELQEDSDGNFYVFGSYASNLRIGHNKLTSTYSKKYYYGADIYLTKINNSGQILWAKTLPFFHSNSQSYSTSYSIRLDSKNNIYMFGYFIDSLFYDNKLIHVSKGQSDGYVIKLDSGGKYVWSTSFGGEFSDFLGDVTATGDNKIVIAGAYHYRASFQDISLACDNGANTIIAVLDSSGNLKSYVEPNSSEGTSRASFLSNDDFSNIYAVGKFRGEVIFNDDTLINYDYSTMYLTKIGSCDAEAKLLSQTQSEVCHGETVTLEVENKFDSYAWYRNGERLKNAASHKLEAGESGIYRVVADSGNCVGVSNTVEVKISRKADLGGNRVICPGDKINIAPGEFSDYAWSNGATGKSIEVQSEGKYFVTVSDGNGCVSSDTIIISYNAPPKPEIRASPGSTFCNGDSIYLQSHLPYATYQWFKNGQIMFGKTRDYLVVKDTGAYMLRVSNPDNCYHYDTIKIVHTQLTPPVLAASGPLSICEGESVTLVAPAGFTGYRWYKNNQLILNQKSDQLEVKEAGNYHVRLDSGNCHVNSAGNVVNVFPRPKTELPDSMVICDGSTAELDAGNFLSYKWNTGDTTRRITLHKSGVYAVEVRNAFGCADTDSTAVTIKNFTDRDILLRNDTLFASPAHTYQWYYDGILIQGAVHSYYIPQFDGHYTVVLGDDSGCEGLSNPHYYERKTVWQDGEQIKLRIYPNPAHDFIYVEFYFGPNVVVDAEVGLHDALGKSILSDRQTINSNFSQKLKIDVSLVREGVYFLSVRLNDFHTVRKVIKIRNK